MKKNLTLRYAFTQCFYWASAMGAASYATTVLLDKGLPSGLVGTLLAGSGILACLSHPLFAAYADRSKKYVLPQLALGLSAFCALCFALQFLPGLPVLAAGILYVLGMWSSDAILPLLNALNVACDRAGYPINFGAARGVGSVASATASLVLGHILAKFGHTWLFLFVIFFRLLSMVTIAGFPRLEKQLSQSAADTSCAIWEFFLRYKWFCLSLLGIGCLGMFHSMTECYLISIMERLGGDSSNVGTALFISSMSGAPVIFFYAFFHKRLKNESLLKIAAFSFLLKSLLFCLAPSIGFVYALEVLQATSYAFLGPTQVFYAGDRVKAADMVKGQAFVAVAYTLGCSAGNFAGGQLLNIGVDAMLLGGVIMALSGTVILLLTLHRSDI